MVRRPKTNLNYSDVIIQFLYNTDNGERPDEFTPGSETRSGL